MNEKAYYKKHTKILLLNLGYCTKINGSVWQYLTKLYRYIFLPRKIQQSAINKLQRIIDEKKPDIVCLLEIKKGKQFESLTNKDYSCFDIETKYGLKSLLRKLPFFKNKCNAFLSKMQVPYKKHFLKHGTKKLLYEIEMPDETRLLLMHFSLNKKTRKKQFKEICKKFSKVKQKVLCGDFNIYGGISELTPLMENADIELASSKPTFPAFKPTKPLDLFLCSDCINTEVRVLHDQLSDHLPTILEISV